MKNSEHTFLAGGGVVGALLRSHDWSHSPLGAPEGWPNALRPFVRFALHSGFPTCLIWGSDPGFIYNDAFVDILGDKHPAALGGRFKTIWREVLDDVLPLIDRALSGELVHQENLPLVLHRNGVEEPGWFTFSYSPICDERGQVAGLCCTCIDTTAQMLAKQAHAKEHAHLFDLFEQAPGAIAVTRGPEHIYELANASYYAVVGRQDFIGKTVREALPEIETQGLIALLDKVYATAEPFVGSAMPVKFQRTPLGGLEERYMDFVMQPIKNRFGAVSGIFVQGNDVTDSIVARNALRDSEARLRQLANNIPHLAWIADATGSIHWYNDRWYDYTGTTFEQMAGWGWQSVHHPDRLEEIVKQWSGSVATGEPFEAIFPIRGADGEFRSFFTRVAPLRDATGTIIQWFGTNTDVTALEEAQNELRVANRRKDEFLAMLAHELRNPLAPISTAAWILTQNGVDAERLRKSGEIIRRQVEHMTKLIDDLLDVSRVTGGLITLRKEMLDVNSVIADALEQARALVERKRQTLTLQLPDTAIVVEGDRTRLVQSVANILNNAAKYTPNDGQISLQVIPSAEAVEVVITDDGIGIPADLLPDFFDLFTQAIRSPDRAQGGLGLGLPLVKNLIELHGGSVSIRSAGPDRGTQVSVRLARLPAAAILPPSSRTKSA